jgi:putative spermidine/putrescine transport system substrate-binding protein
MKRQLSITLFLALFLIPSIAWTQPTITICSYGGTYNQGLEEVFGKPFTQATGIKVIVTTVPTYAQMEAQVKSGNIEWDIVDAENRMYARGVKSGIFEPMDLSLINTQDFVKGSVKKYGVGLVYYSYNISYNTDKWPVGKGPSSMKDLWDVKRFPGPRMMKLTAFSNLEAALLADGVPRDKIYPINVDRALKKMDELKPYVQIWWKTGGQAQQALRQKEVDVAFFSGGRVIQLMEQKVPVTFEWNDQLVILDYWTILKGSKNKDAAMKFIAFASDPKRQAGFAEWTYYGAANTKAYNFIKKEKAMLLPTYPENFAKAVVVDEDWYAEHEESVEQRWDAWRMK